MSKLITDKEILAALTKAIQNQPHLPWATDNTVLPEKAYAIFLHDLGSLVARHFGGRCNQVSPPDGIEDLGYTVSFSWNFRVPSNGGIYADLDSDVTLEDWRDEMSWELTEFGNLI